MLFCLYVYDLFSCWFTYVWFALVCDGSTVWFVLIVFLVGYFTFGVICGSLRVVSCWLCLSACFRLTCWFCVCGTFVACV